jgi:4-diphosphocytidyl-2-C-methyl-D-erythritol kinase
MPAMWFVLVNPRFEVSTKKVYQSLKMGLTKEVIKYNIPRLRKVPQVVRALSNDLENVTVKLHPVIDEIKDILVTYGALGSLMSGSGPTVFGIFGGEETARKAEEKLSTENVGSVFLASSL